MSDAMRAEVPGLREGLSCVPDQVALETEDFTEEQLAHRQEEPAWAQWSVDQQIRHIASPPCSWLLDRFRDGLIARGYKLPDLDPAALRARQGPFIPPGMAPDREAVIELMRTLLTIPQDVGYAMERDSRLSLQRSPSSSEGSLQELMDIAPIWIWPTVAITALAVLIASYVPELIEAIERVILKRTPRLDDPIRNWRGQLARYGESGPPRSDCRRVQAIGSFPLYW